MSANSNRSYYDILGISKTASSTEIKKKWRELCKLYHPDRLPTEKKEWGTKMIKEVNEAYAVLSDKEKKDLYDRYGKAGLEGTPMPNMDDILKQFMGERRREPQVPSVKIIVNVTLEDVYSGKKIKKEIERYSLCKNCDGTGNKDRKLHKCKKCNGKGKVTQTIQMGPGIIQQMHGPCRSCRGSGRDFNTVDKCETCSGNRAVKENFTISFTIPPGVTNRDVIVVENQGNEIPMEDRRSSHITRGNIEVIINEQEHKIFKRGVVFNQQMNPANICLVLEIPLEDAIMGFKKTLEHLDGRKLYIEETKIIKDEDVRVVPDEGLPYKGKLTKGDLFIKYKIKFPENLNDQQRYDVYKALTGKEYKQPEIPENYEYLQTFNADGYSRNNPYDSDSDGMGEQGGVECATQ